MHIQGDVVDLGVDVLERKLELHYFSGCYLVWGPDGVRCSKSSSGSDVRLFGKAVASVQNSCLRIVAVVGTLGFSASGARRAAITASCSVVAFWAASCWASRSMMVSMKFVVGVSSTGSGPGPSPELVASIVMAIYAR